MAKKCKPIPFNPWPSFVDLFSSVILVLIFFILFIVVLLAYYMQFKYTHTDSNKIVVETKKFGQPIEGKASVINKIPEPRVPSKPKLKDMKIALEIGSAKENIKPKKEELGDYLLLFFNKKSVALNQADFERIKEFLMSKDGQIEIEISIPKFSNRKIINKKKAMLRGINLYSYIKKLAKLKPTLKESNFDLKSTSDIIIKEELNERQQTFGYTKIYIK